MAGVKLYGGPRGAQIWAIGPNNVLSPIYKDGKALGAMAGQYIGTGSGSTAIRPNNIGPGFPVTIYVLDYNTVPKRGVIQSDVSLTPNVIGQEKDPPKLIKSMVELDNRNTATWQVLANVAKGYKAKGVSVPVAITSDLEKVRIGINQRKALISKIPNVNQIVSPAGPSVIEYFTQGAKSILERVFGIGFLQEMSFGEWTLLAFTAGVFPPAAMAWVLSKWNEFERNFGIAMEDRDRLERIRLLLQKLGETTDPNTRREIESRIMQEVLRHGMESAERGQERAEASNKGFFGEISDVLKWGFFLGALYVFREPIKEALSGGKGKRR